MFNSLAPHGAKNAYQKCIVCSNTSQSHEDEVCLGRDCVCFLDLHN